MLERSGVLLPAFMEQSLFLSAEMFFKFRKDSMLESTSLEFMLVWAPHSVVLPVRLERFTKFSSQNLNQQYNISL